MVWFPERSHSLYFLSTGIGYRLVVSSSWIHSDRIQSKQRCVAFVFHDAELEAALLLIHSVITRRLIPYTSHSRQQWPMSPEPQWCEPVTFLFNCTSAETILVPSFSQLSSPLFHFSLSFFYLLLIRLSAESLHRGNQRCAEECVRFGSVCWRPNFGRWSKQVFFTFY